LVADVWREAGSAAEPSVAGFKVPPGQSFRNVCRVRAVSQYCDDFCRDKLLRRDVQAEPNVVSVGLRRLECGQI
jgi:hypothetical protein